MKKILAAILLSLSIPVTAFADPQGFSVTWSSVPTASKYQLSTRVNTTQEVVGDFTGNTTTVTKDITAGQIFYAKVRACDNIWCGDWSSEVSFTMPVKPATPSITAIQLVIQ